MSTQPWPNVVAHISAMESAGDWLEDLQLLQGSDELDMGQQDDYVASVLRQIADADKVSSA